MPASRAERVSRTEDVFADDGMRGFRVGDRFNVQAVYQFANGRSTVIAGCALLPRRPEMTRCGKP